MHVRASYCAPVLKRTLGIPLVQYVHAMELVAQPRLARFALHHARATIAVSSYSAGLAISHGARAGSVSVIAPGVDAPRARRTERASVPTMVTVARLDDAYKGHDLVIEALPRIRAAVPDVRWLVVGDGALRDALETRVRELGLATAVSFLGAASDEERDLALERAHVFVMPSRVAADGSGGEGFGIAFLEASSCGLPVIAGRAGGAVDAVRDGETGVLVDPHDADAFADAAIGLLTEPARAGALGAAGVAYARGFSWAQTAKRVESVIHTVLERDRR
jgi:phosphatidylinositol alpha-1,6-mannosyltransferase